MYRTLIIGITAASPLLVMGVTRQSNLERRLVSLEEFTQQVPARQDRELHQLSSRLDGLPGEGQVTALQSRLHSLEARLADARRTLESQRDALDEVSQIAFKVRRIDDLEQGMNSRWAGFVRALDATTTLVDETRAELGDVRSQLADGEQDQVDSSGLWSATVGPTVQLRGASTVGSGVLLQSRPSEANPEAYRTLMLTSWHVIRDIRADSQDADCPIPVIVRDLDGAKSEFTATVLSHSVELDSALLILDSCERFDVGAMLPTRDRLASTEVFEDVVAVGCPLGNDPIPTQGHLTDLHHEVADARFWMISAPTYIGNSGGGIYGLTSHELLGIFSKIYTHGSIRPTVIPHMGLVTPLGAIYDWIDGSGVASIIEGAGSAIITLD